MGAVDVHVYHEFAGFLQESIKVDVVGVHFGKGLFSSSQGEDAYFLGYAVEGLGELISVEGRVVADDAAVNKNLGSAVLRVLDLWIEESWRT